MQTHSQGHATADTHLDTSTPRHSEYPGTHPLSLECTFTYRQTHLCPNASKAHELSHNLHSHTPPYTHQNPHIDRYTRTLLDVTDTQKDIVSHTDFLSIQTESPHLGQAE